MVSFFSSWVKGIGLAIIVISILEMILPNNKTKKYIRMVFGVYIMFNIISPFVTNKNLSSIDSYDLNQYIDEYTDSTNKILTSSGNKIEELYIKELEKDISSNIENLGYKVISCNVYATLSSKNEENYIDEIALEIERDEGVENKLIEEIEEIQEIKTINSKVQIIEQEAKENKQSNITNQEINEIKKFLTEEYGVDEKCLKIN